MSPEEPIAIAGMACRFPGGADDPASFWRLMMDGTDAIREVPSDRWSTEKYYDTRPGRPGRSISRWGGFVEDPAAFDHEFFGVSPREAASFDPQHKMLLLAAGEALNDAAQAAVATDEARDIGVFVGLATHEFSQLQSAPQELTHLDAWSLNSIAATLAANRISFAFNLSGPSMAVDTACSSSLVAVHLACEAIRRGECSAALAGGANALYHAAGFVSFSSAGMLSPSGRCKAFDRSADGFVRAEGAGLVFLLPASEARRQGLRVYAEILATAVNQDARKPSLTAPAQRTQADLIRRACRKAGIAPSSIEYVEAHGTGTPTGDPVEAAAIGEVVGDTRTEPCLIGSVKTNIGHLEAAAGIAGLIKTALCLRHSAVPRNLHFTEANPSIDFDALKLRVVTDNAVLSPENGPPIAAVNSFGFGGANAHAILRAVRREGSPTTPRNCPDSPAYLLVTSARSPESLDALAARYRDALGSEDAVAPADLCMSAGERQSSLPHRIAIVAQDAGDLHAKLGMAATGGCPPTGTRGRAQDKDGQGPVFVFCGQGSQWWQMGCGLMREEPVFRAKLEEVHHLIRRHAGWSLLDELARGESDTRLDDTAVAQPAIFALQVALAALWSDWGIRPAAVVGHSVGEAAAAHVAGALDLDEATRIICQRARAMSVCRGTGAMLSVALPLPELQTLVSSRAGRVAIGAINSPRSAVISGCVEEIAELGRELTDRGVPLRKVPVDYAFHSALMEPAKVLLEKSLARIRTSAPSLPLFSSVTAAESEAGDWDAAYWWRNIRQPVLFSETVSAMLERGFRDFLEVGPHPVLAGSLLECLKHSDSDARVFGSLRRHQPERATMLSSLGAMCVAGFSPDWKRIYPGARSVLLPAYPWKLESTWTELPVCRAARFGEAEHPLLGRRSLDAAGTWNNAVHTSDQEYLEGHRVNGQPVFPGAAYAEMGLAVAHHKCGSLPLCLERLEFVKALPVPGRGAPAAIRVSVGLDDACFEISSSIANGDYVLHARGRIAGQSGLVAPTSYRLDVLASDLKEITSGDELRANLARRGLELSGSFAALRSVRWRVGEALAEIDLPAEAAAEANRYVMHPAFFDACFGALACTVPGWKEKDSTRLFLPVEFAQVRLYRRPGKRAWAHARLSHADSFAVEGDLRIFDEEQQCIAEVLGFRARAVPATQHLSLAQGGVYEEQWEKCDERSAAPDNRDEGLLLISGPTDLGKQLQDGWQEAGGRVIVMAPSETNDSSLAQKILPVLHAGSFKKIVFCADPEAAPESAIPADALHLLSFLKILAADIEARGLRIFVVTREARAVADGDIPHPGQAALYGLARTAQSEMPHLNIRLIDIGENNDAHFLREEISDGSAETETAWRKGQRFVPRLRRVLPDALCGTRKPEASELEVRLREPGPGIEIRRGARRKSLAPGEVRLRVEAVGINFRDTMKSLGIYPLTGDLDLLLGDECAGEITEVGEDVKDLRQGDAVFAVTPGCFAGEVVADARRVARRPALLAAAEAATMPVVFLTALYSLRDVGRIRAGDTVLIHSAAGGVGLAAVQLAKLFGSRVFATAGSAEKRELLRAMGVELAMDSRSLAFRDELRAATGGRGVDLVLNSLAGEFLTRSLACLAPGGRFLEIGKRDLYGNSALGLSAFRENRSFAAIDMAQVLWQAPELAREMLEEISAMTAAGQITPLPHRTYPLTQAAEALREMAQGQHVGKIVLEVPRCVRETRNNTVPPLRSDATYLVTGGTRGFGLATAGWLVSHGARYLVLVGRTGEVTPATAQQLDTWRSEGIQVEVRAADVADAAQVERLVGEIRANFPPLRGLLHAATSYESSTLANADPVHFAAAFATKASGAFQLHTATLDAPLDFFVLYSSVAGVLGNAGQAAYAAANAFLEALAWRRRAEGRPALAVSWGVLGDTGHVAENGGLASMFEARGLHAVSSSEAMSLLADLMQAEASHAVVARIDWSRTAEGLGGGEVPPRLRELVESKSANENGLRPFRESLVTLAPGQQLPAMLAEVTSQLADILRVPAESIQASTILQDLGLDSLISIETLIRLERRLGVAVPQGAVAPENTVGQLAADLLRLVQDGATVREEDAAEEKPAATRQPGRKKTDPVVSAAGRHTADAGPPQAKELFRPSLSFYAEWMVLRLLARTFATEDLLAARRRLRRLMPVLRVALRNERAWALKNLRLVFGPHLDDRQRRKLVALATEQHLASYVESGFSHRMEFSFDNYAQLLELAGDHGVILCGIHLGSWEPFLRWAPDIGLRLAAVYRPARNPLSEKFFQQRRASYGIEWIAARDTRAIAQAVEDRKIVAFMSDLNVYESSVFADFLGVPASCGTGPATLSVLKDAPIIPAVGIRCGQNRVAATFGEAIRAGENTNVAGAVAELTARLTRWFEPWVASYAEQYNWLHPRWRARPDGARWTLETPDREMALARTTPPLVPAERVLALLREPAEN